MNRLFLTEGQVKKIKKKSMFKKRLICERKGIKLLYYSKLDIKYPYDVIKNKDTILSIINGK